MPPKRTLRTRASLIREPSPLPTRMSRPRRAASSRAVTIARDASSSPDETNKSLRLTVKMPSSKLREATSASQARASATSRDPVEDSNVVRGPRASRTKKSYVVESESDDDEEDEEEEDAEAEVEVEASDDEEPEDGERVDLVGGDEEEEEEEEEDAEEEEEEEGAGAVEDESAEEEEADEDEDEEMEDAPAPTPPTIKAKGPASKPSVTVTPAQDGKLRDVEAQEMLLASSEADEEDDEELSELESDGEGGAAGEEDAEGEDVDMEDDDDERSLEVGSRASTPDVSKMTKRQKSRLNEVMGSDFLALPMGVSPRFFHRVQDYHYANYSKFRTPNQKTFDSRGACYAPRRNGQKEEEPE